MTDSPQHPPLDETDRRIVDLLQQEGRITNAALAERLHLSPSPCLRRTRLLEERGVITGYRATVDRARLGHGLTVFVEMRFAEHSAATAAKVAATLYETPEVVSAHIVSGSADFLLEVSVADLKAYDKLLFETLLELPGVADVHSNFALRTIKESGPVPTG